MGPGRPPGAQRLSVSIVFHQDNATWLILRGSGGTLFLVHTILKSSPGLRNTANLVQKGWLRILTSPRLCCASHCLCYSSDITRSCVHSWGGERVCELRSNPSGVFEISIPSTCNRLYNIDTFLVRLHPSWPKILGCRFICYQTSILTSYTFAVRCQLWEEYMEFSPIFTQSGYVVLRTLRVRKRSELRRDWNKLFLVPSWPSSRAHCCSCERFKGTREEECFQFTWDLIFCEHLGQVPQDGNFAQNVALFSKK